MHFTLSDDAALPISTTRKRFAVIGSIACFTTVALISSATSLGEEQDSGAMAGFSPVRQYEIVDCLMPGQVRTVGGRIYMTPRRPTRTTVADCQLRGGEFTLYDRANRQSSLNVWLPEAEGGNPEAQVFVGMLYETGIAGVPDYEKALEWYTKAAEQDFTQAQYNIGTLYERGRGVEKDVVEAFNWYRKAQGVSKDNLVYRSLLVSALQEQRTQLLGEIEARDEEIDALRQQIENMKQDSSTSQIQIQTLESIVARFEVEKNTSAKELEALPPPLAAVEAPPPLTPAERRKFRDKDFGRYHALIIGVENYDPLPSLSTVGNDMDRAEQLLSEKYGFSVTRLDSPSQLLVMETVNQYFEDLKDDDNLLIYFAGHGETLRAADQDFGYWLPSDADAPPNDSHWIANELITNHLSRIKARRILVVSDSTYIDLLESSPGLSAFSDDISAAYLKIVLPKRSRLLFSSGTAAPVPGDDGQYSRFADAFLDELEANDQLIHVPTLFRRVSERLQRPNSDGSSEPAFRTIKTARHELGDFFFVPQDTG